MSFINVFSWSSQQIWIILKVQQVLKCVKSTPLMWKRLVLPARWWYIDYKIAACSFRMFKRSYLRQHRLFTFVRHYASREVSCGMLTKICRARIKYLKLSCFFHYPLTVWSHILTGCSQGGKVTLGNTLCTFNYHNLKYFCRVRLYNRLELWFHPQIKKSQPSTYV